MARESSIRGRIRAALKRYDCVVIALYGSALTGRGKPDLLVLVGPAPYRPLFLEVKSTTGAYRPGQPQNIRSYRKRGIPAWGVRSVQQALGAVRWVQQYGERHMQDTAELEDLDFNFDEILSSTEFQAEEQPEENEPLPEQPPQSVVAEDILADLEEAFAPKNGEAIQPLQPSTTAKPIEVGRITTRSPRIVKAAEVSAEAMAESMQEAISAVAASSTKGMHSGPNLGLLETFEFHLGNISMILNDIRAQNVQIIALLKGDAAVDDEELEGSPNDDLMDIFAEAPSASETPKRRGRPPGSKKRS